MVDVKGELKAFTLIETVVAFVIIMISFSIASVTFLSVESSSSFWIKLKMESAIDDLMVDTRVNETYIDKAFEYENFYIDKFIKKIEPERGLILVSLVAETKDGKVKIEKSSRIKIDSIEK